MFLAKRMAAVSKKIQSWDITTATYHSTSASLSAQLGGSTQSMAISTDGAKVYAMEYGPNTIFQYTLSTPWDITSGSLSFASKSFTISQAGGLPMRFVLSDDGARLIVVMYGRYIHQYNLSTAWDISTASFSGNSVDFTALETADNLFGIAVSPSGLRVYVSCPASGRIRQWNLSTPWDLSTATYNSLLSVVTQATNALGVTISTNGQFIYVLDATTPSVYQYSLGTFFEVSTGSYMSKVKSLNPPSTNPSQPVITDEGRKLYVLDGTRVIYRYTMT